MTTYDQIAALSTERRQAWHQARNLLDRATRAGRDLTADEHVEYDRLTETIDQAALRIDQLRLDRDRDLDMDARRAPWAAVVAPRQSSNSDAIADFLSGRSASNTMAVNFGEVRDLLKGTSSAGGHMVPTGFAGQVYESILEVSPIRGLATVIDTPAGETVDWPTVATHGTATATSEAAALTEADPAYGKVSFGAYKYAQLIQVSRELLADNQVRGFEDHLAREFGLTIARASGTAILNGNGTTAPQGVLQAGYGTVTGQTGSTGVPNYSNLVDVVHQITPTYRRNGTWLVSDGFARAVRKLTDTTGQPLWQPSMAGGAPDTLLGYPLQIDPFVPAPGTATISAVFGDFRRAYGIRQAGGLRIERSDDFAFANDLVTFRAVERVDGRAIDLLAATYYRGGAT